MKKVGMGRILMLVGICFLLSACGSKDEEVVNNNATSNQNVATNNTSNNSPITSASSWSDFKDKVNAGSFSSLSDSYKSLMTFNYYNQEPTRVIFSFTKCTITTGKLWIFTSRSSSCGNDFTREIDGDNIYRENGLMSNSSVIEELKTLVNASTSNKMFSTTAYQFRSGDFEYIIDLKYPAGANPIYKRDVKTGDSYQIYHQSWL